MEIRIADNQYPSSESFNGVNTVHQECPTLRLSSHAAESRQSVYGNNAEHEEKVTPMRASQWVGALCVIWFHVTGVLPHSRRQSRVPLSFMPTTPGGFVQPWERGFVSRVRREGAPVQSVADLLHCESPCAMVYNPADPNRPFKRRRYEVIFLRTGID